ncbi:IclR family transcriptional regulator [Saccharopolyspora sp. K220]|uniref:IclR family transcriptional regulator n=1 Tax=Saccharopolyspora soli TaxID=2926618 RepID=UPI001F57EFE6|nr:IclR family transcriptional regulator [Saccharopolyspora soli]MCI2418391.1 IclR family transcriptional regulator [Saccharopolyspora soli]
MQKEPPAYPISSVDNALRLLLMFRDRQRLRLSDVSASLDVAHSTAHRLLAMLAYHDFVRQEPNLRTYIAGPALVDIGFAAVRNMDIRTHARPILEALADEVEETVHLAQMEGNKVRYLDAAECSRVLRVAARTGQLLPANCTATGKALLAELSTEQLDELFPPGKRLPTSTRHSESSRKALDAELARVREQGYATNTRESDEDIVSVATVVRNPRGTAIAAINASSPATRLPKKKQLQVVRQLQSGARQLEEILAGVVSG